MKLSKEQVQHFARFLQIGGCGQWAAFGFPALLNGDVSALLLATAVTFGIEAISIFILLPMAQEN